MSYSRTPVADFKPIFRPRVMAVRAALCLEGKDAEFNALALVPLEQGTVDRPARRDPMEANRG